MTKSPAILDLGRMPYAPALTLQRALHAAISTRTPAQLDRELPDLTHGIILLVEHDPVITLSQRRAAADNILLSGDALAARNITVEETDRGGDVTYHAPGQLVVYPILRLDDFHLNLSRYMRLLEQATIDTLALWNLPGERIPGRTGVWINQRRAGRVSPPSPTPTRDTHHEVRAPDSQPHPSVELGGLTPPARLDFPHAEKICAMGVRISRGTTLHGLALNVNLDLAGFDTIIPCGIADAGVTSLAKLLGEDQPSMATVKSELTARLIAALGTA